MHRQLGIGAAAESHVAPACAGFVNCSICTPSRLYSTDSFHPCMRFLYMMCKRASFFPPIIFSPCLHPTLNGCWLLETNHFDPKHCHHQLVWHATKFLSAKHFQTCSQVDFRSECMAHAARMTVTNPFSSFQSFHISDMKIMSND